MTKLHSGVFLVTGKDSTKFYLMSFAGVDPFLRVCNAINVKTFKSDSEQPYQLSKTEIDAVIEHSDDFDFYELKQGLSMEQANPDLQLKNHPAYQKAYDTYISSMEDNTYDETLFVTKLMTSNKDINIEKANRMVALIRNEANRK
jgi:hypothetical protein